MVAQRGDEGQTQTAFGSRQILSLLRSRGVAIRSASKKRRGRKREEGRKAREERKPRKWKKKGERKKGEMNETEKRKRKTKEEVACHGGATAAGPCEEGLAARLQEGKKLVTGVQQRPKERPRVKERGRTFRLNSRLISRKKVHQRPGKR